ncbi:MAG: shikimate kinase [Candidatus Rokuibacteriota bacterium]|nr:MAG: shikimate kinase [Candidatus Rokubacteria bacterium]
MPRDNVILVGFMGAGKSTCGRLLARRLDRCFVETDDMIVARDGRSIPEIFREDGEAKFREFEAEALEALRLKSGDVIATGGGFACREGRMEQLRELGTVVWLAGDLRQLYERACRPGQRPMLDGRPFEAIEELYREREPYYGKAHLMVDTVGQTTDQVIGRILASLRASHAARV